jgi:hypothetical protein
MNYKVKNIRKDVRKFYDGDLGRDVVVNPGESVITERPPTQIDVWEVKKEEKVEEHKPIKKSKEVREK